ncbi:MAG TPA: MFS transporter [Lacipirellulaceae bacterium]|jgi:OPA family glycerol-3-phosphate transporter-like MFS transporter|nr:MFS transporter [Lacipirellulaceae bacterium]
MTALKAVQRWFAPPPAVPQLPAAEVARVYPGFRWQALEATFIGYALYYLCRGNNVSVVTREMQDSLHYSREMIGTIAAVTSLTYGLSKFLMGAVSDRSDPRKFMSVGLAMTALCNFAFGASSSYNTHLWLWGLNGFFQGMGWPPCGRVMGHWFSESERGLTLSIWNTSHNIGGGIAGFLAAWAVGTFGGWQYAFFVPGIIALAGSVYLFFRLRDTPQSVGLPPVEEFRNDFPAGGMPEEQLEHELSFRELLVEKVLLNPYVWLLAIANFFAYITRYSMLDWGPTYLRDVKEASLSGGGLGVMAIEFGGVPSTIFFGWVSDRIGGRRGVVATLCMFPVMLAYAGMIFIPAGHLWLDYLMLVTVGFFIYPVIGLITVAALDIVSKKAIGTAAGFIGLFGYLGKMALDKGFGWIVDSYSQTIGLDAAWSIVLFTTLASAAIATLLLAIMWKLRPQA